MYQQKSPSRRFGRHLPHWTWIHSGRDFRHRHLQGFGHLQFEFEFTFWRWFQGPRKVFVKSRKSDESQWSVQCDGVWRRNVAWDGLQAGRFEWTHTCTLFKCVCVCVCVEIDLNCLCGTVLQVCWNFVEMWRSKQASKCKCANCTWNLCCKFLSHLVFREPQKINFTKRSNSEAIGTPQQNMKKHIFQPMKFSSRSQNSSIIKSTTSPTHNHPDTRPIASSSESLRWSRNSILNKNPPNYFS